MQEVTALLAAILFFAFIVGILFDMVAGTLASMKEEELATLKATQKHEESIDPHKQSELETRAKRRKMTNVMLAMEETGRRPAIIDKDSGEIYDIGE
jgi:hypothetical protein